MSAVGIVPFARLWWHLKLQTGKMKPPPILSFYFRSQPLRSARTFRQHKIAIQLTISVRWTSSRAVICCSLIGVKWWFPTQWSSPAIFSYRSRINYWRTRSTKRCLPRPFVRTLYLIIKCGQQYGGGGSGRLFISGYYGNENALLDLCSTSESIARLLRIRVTRMGQPQQESPFFSVHTIRGARPH